MTIAGQANGQLTSRRILRESTQMRAGPEWAIGSGTHATLRHAKTVRRYLVSKAESFHPLTKEQGRRSAAKVTRDEARRFNMRPSKLARLIVETVIADDLLDAVLDGLPCSLRRPAAQKRDRKWEMALGYENRLG
jgi:hypothetical protein